MPGDSGPDLDRIRELAAELAAASPGPAGELAVELAAAIASLSGRIDSLWRLISTIVESAGLSIPVPSGPPSEFVQAVAGARRSGRRGVRLSIDGREWVAALSQDAPAPDAASWPAIERIARESSDQDEM